MQIKTAMTYYLILVRMAIIKKSRTINAGKGVEKREPSTISSHQSEWPSTKMLQTINADVIVEKREPSYSVGGNVNWHSYYGEQYGGSLKN